MNEMKLCPFCGTKPTLFVDDYGQYGVMCESCGMYLDVELECGVALHDGWMDGWMDGKPRLTL